MTVSGEGEREGESEGESERIYLSVQGSLSGEIFRDPSQRQEVAADDGVHENASIFQRVPRRHVDDV